MPPLLATIIETQNRLLGLSYTTIHQFCSEHDFPSPPPPMDAVVDEWEAAYGPIQKQIEAFYIIKSGRASRQVVNADGRSSVSPAPKPNGISRPKSSLLLGKGRQENDSRRPSSEEPPAITAPRPQRPQAPKAPPSYMSGVATDFTVATKHLSPSTVSSPGPRGPADQYGHNTRRSTSDLASAAGRKPSTSDLTSVAGKKKPPPPPPKKPSRLEERVVALYDFVGEGNDDLSFREGDSIKIVKKTDTDQDWWVGELRGVRGSFPANYCKPA
ncbi:hypothetical protein IMZ48_38540 [Candidatus Bathyarchaeota archaeon]|nr:hypothetical protein [Candidatus Bathyarchaeota archaeon]